MKNALWLLACTRTFLRKCKKVFFFFFSLERLLVPKPGMHQNENYGLKPKIQKMYSFK